MNFEIFLAAMACFNLAGLIFVASGLREIMKAIVNFRMDITSNSAALMQRLVQIDGKASRILSAGEEGRVNGGNMDEGISNILQFSAGGERR